MRFTDTTLDRHYDEITRKIIKDGSETVSAAANEMRWSSQPLDRARAAVTYCALAEFAMGQDDWQQAAFFWHFAGHGFRTIWMESKAGKSYLRSAECGEKGTAKLDPEQAQKQRSFDLRSLGRARSCYSDAGQTWRLPAIDAMINEKLNH